MTEKMTDMTIDFTEEELVILVEILGTDLGFEMAETEGRAAALSSAKTKLKEALYSAYESDATGFKV
jgi:hypothetical protein